MKIVRLTAAKASFFVAFLLVLVGCGPPEEIAPTTGSIVFGLTSELRVPTDIQEMQVVLRVNGAVSREETRRAGSPSKPLTFPMEIASGELSGGDEVEIELSVFGGQGLLIMLVNRVASTEVVAGRKLLMRVRIETECAPTAGSSVSCDAPQTCITGVCRDSFANPKSLEQYFSAWSQDLNDPCKLPEGGAPIVIVGKGQSDYLPMDDKELAQVEAGPQGGYHIWVAVRMKNLRQSGSITSVTGYVPDLNLELSAFNVIFTFDQDEGGYCKLYGLRYQLDTNGTEIETLLGHEMKVTVKVTESAGSGVGVGERMVRLSDTIL